MLVRNLTFNPKNESKTRHEKSPRKRNSGESHCAEPDGHCVGATADQRRGGDLSVSDLFQMVRRVCQSGSVSSLQLSIHRFGWRAAANHRPDGGLWRIRWSDE